MTELRPVSFNKRRQNEEVFSRKIHGERMFPQCSQFSIRETLFPVSVFVFKMQIMLALHSREQCEQRPNFANTFELDGTIRHP